MKITSEMIENDPQVPHVAVDLHANYVIIVKPWHQAMTFATDEIRRKPAKIRGRRQGREIFNGKPCRCRVCDMIVARQSSQLALHDLHDQATAAAEAMRDFAYYLGVMVTRKVPT